MKRAMKGPSKCLHHRIYFPSRSESRRPSPPRWSHYAPRSWTVFDYQINISYFVVFVFTSQSGGSLLDLLKGQFDITGKGAYLLFHGVMMRPSLLSVKAAVLIIFITTADQIDIWKDATRSASVVAGFSSLSFYFPTHSFTIIYLFSVTARRFWQKTSSGELTVHILHSAEVQTYKISA